MVELLNHSGTVISKCPTRYTEGMIPSLPDRRSACDHGPYSAYCKVCWNAVYIFWIDTHPHDGVCPFGHTSASTCPDVAAASHNTKVFREAREKSKTLAQEQAKNAAP